MQEGGRGLGQGRERSPDCGYRLSSEDGSLGPRQGLNWIAGPLKVQGLGLQEGASVQLSWSNLGVEAVGVGPRV